MTAQTAEREQLQQIIKKLPDENIPAVLLLVKDFEYVKGKAFTGTGDLRSVHADNFKVYQREELYDR